MTRFKHNILAQLPRLILVLVLIPLQAGAQWQDGLWIGKQAYNWCLESNLGIDFNSGSPTAFSGVQLSPMEGTASISTPDGQLLAYTAGTSIWNANHQVMLNGDGIIGSVSSTQHGVFVPKPGNPDIYYLFCVNTYDALTGLTYSEIDFSLDGGLGAVTDTKNVVLDPDSAGEKITAVYHADKQGIWVITHKKAGNEFAAFLVTENGIAAPVISAGGFDYSTAANATIGPYGQMKVSPDGAYLATTIRTGADKGIDLLGFNNLDGSIEFITHLGGFSGELYGTEFSPNGKYVYVADILMGSFGGSVTQYDVTSGPP